MIVRSKESYNSFRPEGSFLGTGPLLSRTFPITFSLLLFSLPELKIWTEEVNEPHMLKPVKRNGEVRRKKKNNLFIFIIIMN